MIVDTTPDIVNERLKTANGFANQNLVIWAKVDEAFPGIKTRRVWNYDNADVLANVPNVIVQVDGSPIGATMHFVRFVGNKLLHDPWDGKEKPTSTYRTQSYAVLTGKWEKPDLQKELDKLRGERDFNHNKYVEAEKKRSELAAKLSVADNLLREIKKSVDKYEF